MTDDEFLVDEELSRRLARLADLGVTSADVGSIARRARRTTSLPLAATLAGTLLIIIAVSVRPPAPAANGPLGAGASMATSSPLASDGASLGTVGGEIPTILDGRPVLSGGAIAEHVAAATNDERFLVGGWLSATYADCAVPSDFPAHPLLAPCHDGIFLLSKPSSEAGQRDAEAVRLIVGAMPGILSARSPLVLEVHVLDSRSATCPAAYVATCERTIVVDDIRWEGGSAP